MEITMEDKIVKSEAAIGKVCALFFGPPEIDFTKAGEPEYKPVNMPDGTGTGAMLEFAALGIWSYRVAAEMEGVPQNVNDYIDGLRPGLGFGCNINIYYNIQNSMGIIYKYMKNENSDDNIDFNGYTSTSDDINVNFIGLNYQYSTLQRGHFAYNFGLGAGYVAYRNRSSADDFIFTLKGGTYGFSLMNRFNLMTEENVAFFLDVSFFYAALQAYKFEGHTVELDEADNLSRFELGIGIKFIGE